MIGITKNAKWTEFETIFEKTILDRYEWFLFEFGKRITHLIHEELLGRVSGIKGPVDYKKRLVVAEIRDRGGQAWWAIVAKAKPLTAGEYDPEQSLLYVIPRYDLGDDDPIEEILVKYGPWTAQTLPFIPSQRQAAVIIKQAFPDTVASNKGRNLRNQEQITGLMDRHNLEYDPRFKIYARLHIIPDLALEAMKLEFGISEKGQAHWRPSLRWARTDGVREMGKDTDLIRVFTDPKWNGYKIKRHLDQQLNRAEVENLERFQKKLRDQGG